MDFKEAKQMIMSACLSKVTLTEGMELRMPILLSLDDTENNKAKLFREALAEVSKVIGAEVRENPKSLEEVNEKNTVMVVFETRDLNGLAPDEILAILKKTFKEISSGRGGLVVFDELHEASPMVQSLLIPVFQGEFEGMDMKAIQIGATTNSKATNKITMPLLNRCLPCSPMDTVSAWMDRAMDGFEMIDGKIDLKSFLNGNKKSAPDISMNRAMDGFEMIDRKIDLKSFLKGNEKNASDIRDFKDEFKEAMRRAPEIMDWILKEITADAPAEIKMCSLEDLLKDSEIRQKAQQAIIDAAAGKEHEKRDIAKILKEITADAPAEMKMRSWEDLLKDKEIRQKAQQEIIDAIAEKYGRKTEKPEPFLVDFSLKGASEVLKRMKGAEAEPKINDNTKPSV